MPNYSVTGLICEDVRPEKSGQENIIGIFPDNFLAPEFPVIIAKFAIYIRIHLDTGFEPTSISSKILLPGSGEIDLSSMDSELVAKARTEAIARGSPIVGLISRGIISPMRFDQPGRMLVMVKIGDEEFPCASLNIEQIPEHSVSTE
jgi:hypothetical protein